MWLPVKIGLSGLSGRDTLVAISKRPRRLSDAPTRVAGAPRELNSSIPLLTALCQGCLPLGRGAFALRRADRLFDVIHILRSAKGRSRLRFWPSGWRLMSGPSTKMWPRCSPVAYPSYPSGSHGRGPGKGW
jgi:hypothetical protein